MNFEYCIAYEDRDSLHTSRWSLSGVNTKENGNTRNGWLWLSCSSNGGTVTAALYKNDACGDSDKVATGTADVTDIETVAAVCLLQEANSSGLAGEFYFEDYTEDVEAVPVMATLCTDADLLDEYHNLADLPADVYDSGVGMARYCAVATQKVLLLVSQMYAEALGGWGAPEHRYSTVSSRAVPDYRAVAAPDQLKDAAVHWALMLAFGSCHERAAGTMYSQLRDYHDAKRKEAIAAWNLALNTDPDSDEDADTSRSTGVRRITRL